MINESEEDWITVDIIPGWSHGYLQMSSLLPGAVAVIEGMGKWITEAFEKEEKLLSESKRGTGGGGGMTRSRGVGESLGRTTTPVVVVDKGKGKEREKEGEKKEDEEEEILSFTPRKNRSASNSYPGGLDSTTPSRSSSPAPSTTNLGVPALVFQYASNPSLNLIASEDGTRKEDGLGAEGEKKIKTSAEYALRDYLPPTSSSPSSSSHRLAGAKGQAKKDGSQSEDERLLSTSSSTHSRKSAIMGEGRTRSGSDSFPASTSTLVNAPSSATGGAGGLGGGGGRDVKNQVREMLKKRREEVVFGIVSASNSAIHSDASEEE